MRRQSMNRAIGLLALAVLLLIMIPAVHAEAADTVASGKCGDNLTWVLDNAGTLTISGTGEMDDFSEGTAPWYSYRGIVKSLCVENGVASIGDYAFEDCYFVTDYRIDIPASVTSIGRNAFDGLGAPVYITDMSAWCRIEFGNWKSNPLSMGGLYLSGKRLNQIVIPDDITEVKRYAFYSYDRMVTLIIPEHVKSLGYGAFDDATGLDTVIFCGDAPENWDSCFEMVEATVFYPAGNSTWTEEVMQNCQQDDRGQLTWIPYSPSNEPLYFIQQPKDVSAYAGDYFILNAAAMGEGVTYQWQSCPHGTEKWSDIVLEETPWQQGANLPRLRMRAEQELAGKIRCVATDKYGRTVTSEEVNLRIRSTLCSDYTPQLVEDAFRYLDEVYIERYPEMALRTLYGTEKDNELLQNLADLIAQGCATDQEKADAVCSWLRRNMIYEDNSFLPIDAFLDRKAVCLGYAELMQDLLRKMGIPAVVGDGWRGDMEICTTEKLFEGAGHAWCFAYLDGEWVMYDPLWFEGGTTDREYIAKWYYFMTVDWILPIYELSNMPPIYGDAITAYTDNRFVRLTKDGEISIRSNGNTMGMTTMFVNGLQITFQFYHDNDPYAWTPMDMMNVIYPRMEADLIQGNCWMHRDVFDYDEYIYVYENGVHAGYVTKELNGTLYYLNSSGAAAYEVSEAYSDPITRYGRMAIQKGERHQVLLPAFVGKYASDEYAMKWESDNEEIATVDQYGNITALKEGYVTISCIPYCIADGAHQTREDIYLYVCDDDRSMQAVDYSDHVESHTHAYIPYVTSTGDQFMTCKDKHCADSYVDTAIRPMVSNIESTDKGIQITWNALKNVEKYRVYVKTTKGWTKLGDTTGTSFAWADAKAGVKYTFTVRGINKPGTAFTTEYNTSGWEHIYYPIPAITKTESTATGIKLTWGKINGAAKYRVFAKTSKGWAALGDTTGTSFTWTGAQEGLTYTFTVRCLSADGKTYTSSYNKTGWKHTHCAAPAVSKLESTTSGIKLTWGKVNGAGKYRVYVKNGSSWTKIGDTTATSFTWTGAKAGLTYTFTVRAMNADATAFVSACNTTGWSHKYTPTPAITKLESTTSGIKLTWGKINGAAKYRVFVKTSNGWVKLADTTSTSYTYTAARAGLTYTFTVRGLNAAGTAFVTGYNTAGWKHTYAPTPQITAMTSTASGIELRWNPVQGDGIYRVFVKTSKGWTKLADVADTVYVYTGAKAGLKYTFTVRMLNGSGTGFASSYNTTGWSHTYMPKPEIVEMESATNGISLHWNPVNGAAKYRVFVKTSKGWTKLTDTTGTSYIYTGAKLGESYTFTVRCLSADGKSYTSAYNTVGWGHTFLPTPAITKLENTSKGIRLQWTPINGAEDYAVYVKSGNSWKKLTEVSNSEWVYAQAERGVRYTFTVCAVGTKATSFYNGTGWSIKRS